MNKENNRSAAGMRRSAIAERIRLREEWSALKGIEEKKQKKNPKSIHIKKLDDNLNNAKRNRVVKNSQASKEQPARQQQKTCNALRGVVALVSVGSEVRALPLRAALSALGASILPAWSPLATHVIWSEGGCRSTRARALALACRLVSPLWVEACAAAARRLPERAFPAAARDSDLPSPHTLTRLLKKAENENIPLTYLLSDSKDDSDEGKKPRLRISSDQDTSGDTSVNTTADTSDTADTRRDVTKSADKTDIEARVNTAPRRAMPKSTISPEQPQPAKSRRKLFTYKEPLDKTADDDSEKETQVCPKRPVKLTQREKRDLARAERMARKLLSACTTQTKTVAVASQCTGLHNLKPRVVLTGMSRCERRAAFDAIKSLGGKVQTKVDRRTTHVLLGACQHAENRCEITGITWPVLRGEVAGRTASALQGAARGCRVLRARWAESCAGAGRWLHHHGYEVPHLRKISQKARVERIALGKQRSEYAYDVFNGMRVFVSDDADHKEAAIDLLTLCGAFVQDGEQNGGVFDVKIGAKHGEVGSKWVFDSVAAARMRTTRRYVNNESIEQLMSRREW